MADAVVDAVAALLQDAAVLFATPRKRFTLALLTLGSLARVSWWSEGSHHDVAHIEGRQRSRSCRASREELCSKSTEHLCLLRAREVLEDVVDRLAFGVADAPETVATGSTNCCARDVADDLCASSACGCKKRAGEVRTKPMTAPAPVPAQVCADSS